MILVQPQQAILDENPQEFLEDSFVVVTGIMISRGDVKLSNSEAKTSTFGIIGISSSLVLLGTYVNLEQSQKVVNSLMEMLEENEMVKENDIGLQTPVFCMPEDEHINKEYKIIDNDYSIKIIID
jgi:hypothetical protein